MPAYFAKLTLSRCFNSAFLLFNLTQLKLRNFPIYVKEEIFVSELFRKCVNAQMRKFTDALSGYSISQKFILNFQLKLSKR